MRGMTANSISPEATARREAARESGRFGTQEHTAPELSLDLHSTELAEGATRVMPLAIDGERVWFDEETLNLAIAASARHDVQGMVSRVVLPDGLADPAARYVATIRSARSGDAGRSFIYETGNQDFEKVTPSLAEVLADAGAKANQQSGRTSTEGNVTALDNLIAVLGEKDARDILADAFLKNGPAPAKAYDDVFTVRHPAYKTSTGMTLQAAISLAETMEDYMASYRSVEVINERTLENVR